MCLEESKRRSVFEGLKANRKSERENQRGSAFSFWREEAGISLFSSQTDRDNWDGRDWWISYIITVRTVYASQLQSQPTAQYNKK